jgi:hypothetical protein
LGIITKPRERELAMTANNHWYVASTGNHQGLVIEETTGANIAVTYDKENAPLVAAAPRLLNALERMLDMFERHIAGEPGPDDAAQRWDEARDAIDEANGDRNLFIEPNGNNSLAAMLRRSRGEE